MPEPLDRTAHRPWPTPAGSWIMAQSWHDLLFAHWRVDAALLRPHIPGRQRALPLAFRICNACFGTL